MKSKKLEQSFEDLSDEYKKRTLPQFDKNGRDYKETMEAHKEFIKQMKENFYEVLAEYNIKIERGGDFDELCSYTEKILLSEDEKHIVQKQKDLLFECAKHSLDITSDTRDENESDERDARNRKLRPTQALQDFKTEARNQIYSQADTFEFLATDFYTENINNLMRKLSSRGVSDRQLESIHFDITQECKVLTRKDTENYQEMIFQDSNRSFRGLEDVQNGLFSRMNELVREEERANDPFGTLTLEEREEHEAKLKQAFDENKEQENDEKSKGGMSLPDSIL